MTTTSDVDMLSELRAACRGPVHVPGVPGYDSARQRWNTAVDQHPAAVVGCTGVPDIRAAVALAHRHGVAVSVRGGGHEVANHANADGSLLLDLSALRTVTVDPAARRAVVSAGVTWAEFDEVCHRHGLAVTGADVSTVGVIGTAVCGGTGWLQRSFGFTCDNVCSAQVVLADGRLVHATTDHHAELLWALRGGTGNFGIVVALELQLHPITTLHAGTLLFRLDQARDVFRRFRELCAEAPDELALRATLLHWPPTAPEGPPMAAITAAYLGPERQARDVLGRLRRIGEPELDLIRPLKYPELQRNTEQAFHDGHGTATGSEWLRAFDDTAIDALVDLAARMPTQYSLISVHQLGGAIRRMPAHATAFGFHDASYHMVLFSGGPPGTDLRASRQWITEVTAAVQQCSAGGPYIGILDDAASPQRVRSAYPPATYERLRRIKAEYDPDNAFRCNHNIPPADPDNTASPSTPTGTDQPGRQLLAARDDLDLFGLRAMTAVLSPALPEGTARTDEQIVTALGVHPRHCWLVRRWLAELTDRRWIRHDPERGYTALREADTPERATLAQVCADFGFPARLARFFDESNQRLPELLQDRILAQELLFPDADLLTADAAYRDNPINRHLNNIAAELISRAVERLAYHRQPIRILELGAGVGGTTADLLPVLDGRGVDYHFTDVSSFFLTAARDRFGAFPWVRYGEVDLNSELSAHPPYDVIVAANVLHNAHDCARTLRQLHDLLNPGGELVFIESCREHAQLLTSMHFLMSARPGRTRAGENDFRAGTNRIFLTESEWRQQLAAAGLPPHAVFPEPNEALAVHGQRVFAAGKPS
ncbi:FAD-binding protein [Nocardia sp. BSTN01]|uniref:FAD-binding protein n=1 Tax=Nocardia sp. BSTN01 TaxID=2783665 RepID=UPI00188EC040|nr:FAD-binding protein [Nocardia sp. BSTN01]MBF5000669.1 FAD-binding protein [Nocardia sp. BSTN01]